MKLLIQLVLWVIIAALGYLLFNAIYGEVKFNEVKEKRYLAAIENLKDIRVAQLAHKTVTGRYEGDFDKLVRFIDTAQFTLTQRRDSTIRDEVRSIELGVDMVKDIVIIDTLGFRSVKDSLYKAVNGKSKDRYKTMINVPVEGTDAKFEMTAGFIEKSNLQIPVFEAKVSKETLLFDQKKDYLIKEKQVVSVDAVNGTHLTVGSMIDINSNGNWPKSYGANDE